MFRVRRWIEDDQNFNRPLRRQELLDRLSARTIALKQCEIDRTIPGKIDAANRHYDESYRPIGAGLFDIDRPEVDVLRFDTIDWDHEREQILSGPDEWRAAGAQVVVEEIKEASGEPRLRERIIKFFNDPAELVRDRAADVFRWINAEAMGRYADLYRAFLSSPYFKGERTYFMHRLEEASAELDEFTLELLELAIAKLPKAGTARGSIGYRLWEPLMRIYTSHDGDPAMRKRCLDLFDQLVANDIGGSDKLSEAAR